MPREQIPVTPSVIRWARMRAGYSVEEAEKYFKRISEWEEDDNGIFPTYPQLEQLAEKFQVPIAVFFFPAPPDTPPISESFRTLPESQIEQIPREVRNLLRKAKAFQLNLAELNNGQNPAERQIIREISFTAIEPIIEKAQRVRSYIGVSLEEQCSWVSADEAFSNWRKQFASFGVTVFKDAFRVEGYSGFCLYDQSFPLIYVNNSTAKTRQIFTLFHELAHLIYQTSGIDTKDDELIPRLPVEAQQIEVTCNQFAAEFLVPDEELNHLIAERPANEETAEAIAAQFNVSRELVFRKFLDRRLIDQTTYLDAAQKWAEQSANGGSGGNWYNTKIAYLGRDYIAQAFSQYYQHRINENQLAEYLDTKPRNLETLEEYFAKRVA